MKIIQVKASFKAFCVSWHSTCLAVVKNFSFLPYECKAITKLYQRFISGYVGIRTSSEGE